PHALTHTLVILFFIGLLLVPVFPVFRITQKRAPADRVHSNKHLTRRGLRRQHFFQPKNLRPAELVHSNCVHSACLLPPSAVPNSSAFRLPNSYFCLLCFR